MAPTTSPDPIDHPARPTGPVHDVIVVGARCAGASTAALLARMGHDVVVVDRAAFPSDTLSTHVVARTGVVQLQRWGLLDAVLASGAPPLRAVSFHVGGEVVERAISDHAGVDLLVAPRRHVLDAILVDAAVAAGASLQTGTTVTGLQRDGTGRVVGITGRDANGSPVALRGHVVVGADGLHSRVARAVEAPTVDERPAASALQYAYVAGAWPTIELHVADGAFAGVFPTHGGEANVWIAGPAASAPARPPGADPATAFLARITHHFPALGERLADAPRPSPVRGFAGAPNRIRRAAGPGWALVGDAGLFRDPVSGHGISDAFRDAEHLARAVDAALRGVRADGDALRAYEAARDRDVAALFAVTARLAAFPPADTFVALQRRLAALVDDEAAHLAACPPLDLRPARAA